MTDGGNERGRKGWGLRSELDWQVSKSNSINLGFRYGGRIGLIESELRHDAWSDADGIHLITASQNFSERSGNRLSLFTTFQHSFDANGHNLTLNAQYASRNREEDVKNELFGGDDTIVEGTRSTEDGSGGPKNINLDYVKPFSEESKLEAGVHSRSGHIEENTQLFEYDTTANAYEEQIEFSNSTDYRRDIHAIYSTFSNSLGRVHYQIGLRGEYTYRKVEIEDSSQRFTIDRWDYFPTTHLSYDLGDKQQLMASYARRVQRARRWYLEPFITWSDAHSVRRGNPALDPEYIDSYEAGYQTKVLGSTISLEGYYRVTHNRVEFIKSVYAENVTLRSVENVGKDYSLGTEYRLTVEPARFWDLIISGNLYDYRVKGELDGRSFDEHDFTWDARVNNTLELIGGLRLQVDGMYKSPSVTSQGTREDIFIINAGLRKQFWNKHLTATLQARDLLATGKHAFTSSGADFYEYRYLDRDAPVLMLNLSFNFNNYRAKGDRGKQGTDLEGEDDF